MNKERLSLQEIRMNFLSQGFFQRSFYLSKREKTINFFKIVFGILFIALLCECGLIAYNQRAFIYLNEVNTVEQEFQLDVGGKEKLALIQQYESENSRIVTTLDWLAEIKPETIEFSKLSISKAGEVLIDAISDNPNHFNDFIKRLKEETILVEEASLVHFSTSNVASETKKMGVVKIKLRKRQ